MNNGPIKPRRGVIGKQSNPILAFLGLGCILVSLAIVGYVLYATSSVSTTTRTFSTYTILTSSWELYKRDFINADGRVLDHSQNDITTSEGQSYALLRAVWSDDKPTFDRVWKWTRENLKRPNDKLLGWRWGKREDTTYGFLPNGGDNPASDADVDTALALILASRRWQDRSYSDAAKLMLDDIWKIETAEVKGKRYLIAGNWANTQDELILNPSYFAPYAYRIFASVDTSHDWLSLVGPSYEVLTQASAEPLDKAKSAGLPPDWVAMNKTNGKLSATKIASFTTNYSYDAVRVPFRIGLDYQWNKDPRAKEYLTTAFRTLAEHYKTQGRLAGVYAHDGSVLADNENPILYATLIGYAQVVDEAMAKKLYDEKIVRLYANDQNSFREDLQYYEQNWLWFGAAMYNRTLVPFSS